MTSIERRPQRVIYNFVDRCNMACSFCYVPFDRNRANAAIAELVMSRVLSWRIGGLVVGGGDPLVYGYTLRLLQQARESDPNLFIQLDTNALGNCHDRLLTAAKYSNLVGLPVDGIDKEICEAMRGRATHGREILKSARLLVRAGHAVKINTVVSTVNQSDISRIRRAVKGVGASIWSLYQFWEIGDIAVSNAAAHRIATPAYQEIVRRQKRRVGKGLTLETSGSIADRAGSYFFVSPTGRAFCTTSNGNRFLELGNVLHEEREVLDRWYRYADTGRNGERWKQRERVLQNKASEGTSY